MTSSDLKFLGKMTAQRLTSLVEDAKNEQAEILADQEHWKKHGTNRRSGASKREIMEELSREGFPWEE
jgi:hypothetical protein